jgi:ribosomal protein S18 acetylase RimI-like enzyme
MDIQFRPARPDDVDVAVPLVYSSGPSAFDFVFSTDNDGSALDFLRSAWLDGAGEFGYRNHVVGTLDDRITAVGGGWSGKTGISFMAAGARQIVSQYGLWGGVPVIFRGLRTEGVIPPPSAQQFYLGHLGVLPELQGKGIGKLLIAHLLESGAVQGFKIAALDVAVTNDRGQALYERLGFHVNVERQSKLKNKFGQVANHRNMQIALKPEY